MPSNNNEITSYVKGEAIYIRMPISLLVHSQKMRPEEPYRVLDKKAMSEWIADNIIEYSKNAGYDEMGLTVFKVLVDQLFSEAYENGETWLSAIGWDEE